MKLLHVLAMGGMAILVSAVPLFSTPAFGWDAPRNDAYGVFTVPLDRRSPRVLQELGVGWIRQQVQLGDPTHKKRVGIFINKVLPHLAANGIGVWVTLYHREWDNADEAGTVGFAKAKRGGFPPRDHDRYADLVEAIVREMRDAVLSAGSMPSRFLVIQFGNEVVPRDVRPPDRPIRFWHGTADQYLAMLEVGYDAVKRIDPGIPVASAGISSAAMEAVMAGETSISAWNTRLLKEGRFDFADVHLRHGIDDVAAKVHWVRERWFGPIASTELAGPDPRTEAFTETRQAEDLVRRIGLATEAGVDRVFWSTLVDTKAVAEVHQHEGLISPDDPWRYKPAFDAYRNLISEAQ